MDWSAIKLLSPLTPLSRSVFSSSRERMKMLFVIVLIAIYCCYYFQIYIKNIYMYYVSYEM